MNRMQRAVVAVTLSLGIYGSAAAQDFAYEKLDRGLVGVKTSSGVFLSWRLLGTDDGAVSFDIYRDGELVNTDGHLTSKTNYVDAAGTATSVYTLKTFNAEGEEVETTMLEELWGSQAKRIKLDVPAAGTHPETDYPGSYWYRPNDASVGDVDGDGQYEIILKWDPNDSKDNSQYPPETKYKPIGTVSRAYTGNTIIDCYTLSGERKWRINLGRNIRSGAHYTQFLVYDLDGDGKAEVACKTAPGSIDGLGKYVTEAATDEEIKNADNTKLYITKNGSKTGFIVSGPEYYTVFNGETGAAMHTVNYQPARSIASFGDSYGNRSERYLAAVAYLKGVNGELRPCLINSRGYYTQAYVWAAQFDGHEIKTVWLHKSESLANSFKVVGPDGTETTYAGKPCTSGVTKADTYQGKNNAGAGNLYGNGNHNMSVADVDGDGYDEILWGAAALDDDGKVLYSTGYGHGDAMHVADLDPTRPGLEVFEVHEEKFNATHGCWDVHDAATGEILLKGGPADQDNGRGIAAQLSASHYGAYFYSGSDKVTRSCVTGEQITTNTGSTNFRIYWDGDPQEELLDGANRNWEQQSQQVQIKKYYDSSKAYSTLATLNGMTCNTTKSTPTFMGDILGDWREEIVLHDSIAPDNMELVIYTTTIPSDYRVVTLPHDHTYRMGMVWEQTAYNQPPHIGYYLPDRLGVPAAAIVTRLTADQTVEVGDAIEPVVVKLVGGDEADVVDLPEGLEYEFKDGLVTFNGRLLKSGNYTFKVRVKTSTGYGPFVTLKVTGVTPQATLIAASNSGSLNQDILFGAELKPIVMTLDKATDVTVDGLPEGVSAVVAEGVMTISGAPAALGTYEYTLTPSPIEGAEAVVSKGKITVTLPKTTLTLVASSGDLSQYVIVNKAIATITLNTANVSGVTSEGLPEGVTVDYADGKVTISGAPTAVGKYPFTLTTVPVEGYESTSVEGVIEVLSGELELIAKFSFEDNLVNDATGEAAEAAGELSPTYVPGIVGNAISFSGVPSTERVSQTHYDALSLGKKSFTISFWINSSMAQTDNGAYIFHSGSTTNNSSTGATGKWVGIEYKKTNFTFAVDDDVTKSQVAYTSTSKIFDGEWHNIVCVRDVSAKKLLMYVDGVLVVSATDNTGDISQTEETTIGNCTVNYNTPLTGTIDEFAIYESAMSAGLVAAKYNEVVSQQATRIAEIHETVGDWVVLRSNVVRSSATLAFDGVRMPVSVAVVDAGGRTVAATRFVTTGEDEVQVDTKTLQPGIYILKATSLEGVKTWRIVKK
ncbi:MAG: FG-GAP repeat protein [Bacteroidales bacterium]|nr:FG-GAP repeat protein [Bacteroidales bacterium]